MAASRSIEEVADLEKALCLLIKRAAGIHNAKEARCAHIDTDMAARLAKLHSGPSCGETPRGAAAAGGAGKRGQGKHEAQALHAEAGKNESPAGDESPAGVGSSGVDAESELIPAEIEAQLPLATRRVSFDCLDKIHVGFTHPKIHMGSRYLEIHIGSRHIQIWMQLLLLRWVSTVVAVSG